MISVFDLFKIGIGPSSSHTMGPMKAAANFLNTVLQHPRTTAIGRVRVILFGSLAWTGKGHVTDKAIVLGPCGYVAETIDPNEGEAPFAAVKRTQLLQLSADRVISFSLDHDVVFDLEPTLPQHRNGLTFAALDAEGRKVTEETWYSVGGGFIVREGSEGIAATAAAPILDHYSSAAKILLLYDAHNLFIADLVLANEAALCPHDAVLERFDRIAGAIFDCIDRGMRCTRELPGGLKVQRQARGLYAQLHADQRLNVRSAHEAMEYVNVYAIAVNEECAADGRVASAPINGAAGVIPAVLRYYRNHCVGAS